jgi:hypothetical protein
VRNDSKQLGASELNPVEYLGSPCKQHELAQLLPVDLPAPTVKKDTVPPTPVFIL